MKIVKVELIHLDVLFTLHTNQHMQDWLPHWRITQPNLRSRIEPDRCRR
jgi:hypothetical protein